MALPFQLDRDQKQSLYRQIAEQFKTEISSGRLPAGSKLPTVRQLAEDAGVTRLTVQTAYNELRADGWIESTVGRGTFVSPHVQPQELHSTIGHCLTTEGVLGDLLEINSIVGVRTMAIAEPDSDLFPVDEFWNYMARLRPKAARLLGYIPPQGDPELRVAVASLLEEFAVQALPDDILITNGVMQGLSLTTQAILQPGDPVLIDQPTFIGYLNILRAQGIEPLVVPFDNEGPCLEVMERHLQAYRPRLYYAIPNFHNPTGRSWSAARRHQILDLARRYDFYIAEDNVYGRVRFTEERYKTLKSMDPERVIYLSGLSKVLMPGLRIGYLVAPQAIRDDLLRGRRANDLCGGGILHRATALFLQEGGLKRHLRRVIPAYRQRRDTLLSALDRFMPPMVDWTNPDGGYSTWLTFPRLFTAGELYRKALQQGFAFTAGEAYLINDEAQEHLRLCFGNQTEEGIWAGVELLANLMHKQLNSKME